MENVYLGKHALLRHGIGDGRGELCPTPIPVKPVTKYTQGGASGQFLSL